MSKSVISSVLYPWDCTQCPQLESLLDQLSLLAPLSSALTLAGAVGTGRRDLARLVHQQSSREQLVSLSPECFVTHGVAGLNEQVNSEKSLSVVVEDLERWPEAAQFVFLQWLRGEVPQLRPIFLVEPSFSQQQVGSVLPELYFLLSVAPLLVPALSERKADLPMLLRTFSRRCVQGGEQTPISFSAAAIKHLKAYHWPGNLLEMQLLCERLNGLLPGRVIQPGNLPAVVQNSANINQQLNLESKEVDTIKKALQLSRGNKSQAARLLGISRDTLNYRLRKYTLV